jgi:thioredoxin-dependent adenylylsulfate APS reductase
LPEKLNNLESTSAVEVLEWAIRRYGSRLAISTSFQAGGMVIVDMASRISSDIRVFTLDTGRLPDETYRMIDTVRERYGIQVEIVLPDPAEVESMVSRHGLDLFYREVPLRMLCCHIRKVRPLERKLAELDAWVTGLRREQSESRAEVDKVESVDGRVKISPLADWSREQVEEYIREHDVPMHPLYAQGYTSIGCAPCTRAITPGERERAGRWWWELDAQDECGIHFTADGKAERAVDVLVTEILSPANA